MQNKKPHNVLVIHSFNKNDSWVEDLNKGIKEAFDDKNLDTQINEYYLSSELRTEEAKQNEINNQQGKNNNGSFGAGKKE